MPGAGPGGRGSTWQRRWQQGWCARRSALGAVPRAPMSLTAVRPARRKRQHRRRRHPSTSVSRRRRAGSPFARVLGGVPLHDGRHRKELDAALQRGRAREGGCASGAAWAGLTHACAQLRSWLDVASHGFSSHACTRLAGQPAARLPVAHVRPRCGGHAPVPACLAEEHAGHVRGPPIAHLLLGELLQLLALLLQGGGVRRGECQAGEAC